MLTLGTIIQNLYRFDPNGTRIAGIPYVRATSLRVGYSKSIIDGHGGYIVRSICKTKTPNHTLTGYDDYVTTIDFISPKGYVKVSCSCPDFWATFEYALHAKGASEIHYCNGEPPNERNHRQMAGCCIAEGEFIQTKRGQIPVEDVKVGDRVLTLNGYEKVTDSALTRENTATLTISLKQLGRTLTVTPDHKVMTVRDGELPKWTEARNIKTGDFLVELVDTNTNPLGKLIPEAVVLGYLISEGGERGYAPMEKDLSGISSLVSRLIEPDIRYVKVKEVKKTHTKRVYDLTVANTPHFTANGFVVHNCKHIVKMAQVLKQTNHIDSSYRWIPQSIKKKNKP